MKYRSILLPMLALISVAGHAQEPEQVTRIFNHSLSNVAGKSMLAFVVAYPPGGKSQPHRHPDSAFVYAHVLTGAIRSQVDDQPAKLYRAGEDFFEPPGSHHRVSENASDCEAASLLAVFVVDSRDVPVTKTERK